MELIPEEYTRHYIMQALFKLMGEYEYEKISVTDIAKKAGVGRATFYRYFKCKEDVIMFYFEHNRKKFMFEQRFFPRCKEDYTRIVTDVLNLFLKNKQQFKLIKRAHLEYIYLTYLNNHFTAMFAQDFPRESAYAPYLYAGMLFNVSMAWLEGDCKESVASLAELIINAIYNT